MSNVKEILICDFNDQEDREYGECEWTQLPNLCLWLGIVSPFKYEYFGYC